MHGRQEHVLRGEPGEATRLTPAYAAQRGRLLRGIAMAFAAMLLLLPMLAAAADVMNSCTQLRETAHATAGSSLHSYGDPGGTGGLDGVRGACAMPCPGLVLPRMTLQVPAMLAQQETPSAASHPAGEMVPRRAG